MAAVKISSNHVSYLVLYPFNEKDGYTLCYNVDEASQGSWLRSMIHGFILDAEMSVVVLSEYSPRSICSSCSFLSPHMIGCRDDARRPFVSTSSTTYLTLVLNAHIPVLLATSLDRSKSLEADAAGLRSTFALAETSLTVLQEAGRVTRSICWVTAS